MTNFVEKFGAQSKKVRNFWSLEILGFWEPLCRKNWSTPFRVCQAEISAKLKLTDLTARRVLGRQLGRLDWASPSSCAAVVVETGQVSIRSKSVMTANLFFKLENLFLLLFCTARALSIIQIVNKHEQLLSLTRRLKKEGKIFQKETDTKSCDDSSFGRTVRSFLVQIYRRTSSDCRSSWRLFFFFNRESPSFPLPDLEDEIGDDAEPVGIYLTGEFRK